MPVRSMLNPAQSSSVSPAWAVHVSEPGRKCNVSGALILDVTLATWWLRILALPAEATQSHVVPFRAVLFEARERSFVKRIFQFLFKIANAVARGPQALITYKEESAGRGCRNSLGRSVESVLCLETHRGRPSSAATLRNRRKWRGASLNSAARKVCTRSQATAKPKVRPPGHRMFR